MLSKNALPIEDVRALQSNEEGAKRRKEAQNRLTVMTTLNLSLDAIEAKHKLTSNSSCAARELLTACAYLASHNIPKTLLEKWLKKTYPTEQLLTSEIINQLYSHSLNSTR